MGSGLPGFTRSSTRSVLLWYASRRLFTDVAYGAITLCGRPSQAFPLSAIQLKAPATPGRIPVWAVPLSLAATDGIDRSFFSCRYLDVSVPCVRSIPPIHSAAGDPCGPGFPIQKSWDQRLFASFSRLIAGFHVFHRLSMPRHPPYALSNLTTIIDHRRSRSAASSRHSPVLLTTDFLHPKIVSLCRAWQTAAPGL